jgi:signal transduction histidine kinase
MRVEVATSLGSEAIGFERRLRRAEESRDWCLRLISKLIHEMSQPLTTLAGEMQLALQDDTAAEAQYRAVLETCLPQVERLHHLVRRLREFAQVERSVEPGSGASLLGAISGAIETFRPLAESKRVKITARVESDPVVAISAERLRQVVHHMLSLAVERSPAGAEVRLAVSLRPTTASLAVSDQGAALRAEDMTLLLDPLLPNPNQHVDFVENGLEWCLARRTAEVWWGTFNLASETGQGCLATLTLPRWSESFKHG